MKAMSTFALLLATRVGLADTEVRRARTRVADPPEAPDEGIRAEGASACVLKQLTLIFGPSRESSVASSRQ